MDLSGNDVFLVGGIQNITFFFADEAAAAANNVSLAYDAATQQVLLNMLDPSAFAQQLLKSPLLFLLSITEGSEFCYLRENITANNAACTSIFTVSVHALEMNDCPSNIAVTIPVTSTHSGPIVWQEPSLNATFPFLSNFQPGDAFPIGTTSVLYQLDSSIQSAVQSLASRITCQFNVCRPLFP